MKGTGMKYGDEVLVIRYKVEMSISDSFSDVAWLWAVCRLSRRGDLIPRICSKDKAMRVIEEYGLVRTHKDENGSVFDTPSKDFQKLYKGKVFILEPVEV